MWVWYANVIKKDALFRVPRNDVIFKMLEIRLPAVVYPFEGVTTKFIVLVFYCRSLAFPMPRPAL